MYNLTGFSKDTFKKNIDVLNFTEFFLKFYKSLKFLFLCSRSIHKIIIPNKSGYDSGLSIIIIR